MFGQDAIDWIGLMSGKAGKALDSAVCFGEAKDGLENAEESSVEGEAIGDGAFAVLTDHAAV